MTPLSVVTATHAAPAAARARAAGAASAAAPAISVRRRVSNADMSSLSLAETTNLYAASDRRYQTRCPNDRRDRDPRPHVHALRAGVDADGADDRLPARRRRLHDRHHGHAAHRLAAWRP